MTTVHPVLAVAHKHVAGLRQGAGDNWTGYCPFHGEIPGKSKPSFSFNSSTGQWYCFTEGRGGSMRTFLKELGKGRDTIDMMMERLDPLLEKAYRDKPLFQKRGGVFKTDYPLPERILGLFEHCPESLLDAGFDENVLWDHDVGVDLERNRITFPVRDLVGTLAGIVGRTTNPKMKYKVYQDELRRMGFPRYEIDNHSYLWRWDRVYPQCYVPEERPTVYVAEGFKACLWMVQHGYENTLALMGTSLSRVQKVFLERLGGSIIWCLDNDRWGRAGTQKNGYKVQGVRQFVMNYPAPDVQPDDLSGSDLHEAIASSLSFARWAKRRE